MNPHTLPIHQVMTPTTSLDKASQQSKEMLRHCRHRVMHCRDPLAVVDLLAMNPAFMAVPWVRDTLLRLVQSKRNLHRRGRPPGSFAVNPMVIYGLVEQCLEMIIAKNKERAFWEISNWLGNRSYEEVKRLYYQAMTEDRFQAVLMQFPDLARRLTEEEMMAELQGAQTLGPGQSLTLALE